MKKILFATTALVATASVAAADVSFGGYGRFGALNNGTVTGVFTRLRLQIDMSTEADNGLAVGARLRHQQDTFNGARHGRTPQSHGFNAARFYARTGGFEIGVGNIQGAWEWMPGVYAGTQSASVGLSGLGFHDTLGSIANTGGGWTWDAYESRNSGGQDASTRNGVEVKYSAGDFAGHLSYSKLPGVANGERVAAHVSYNFNDWTVAVGMQSAGAASGANDMVGLTVGGKIGPASVTLGYVDTSGFSDQIVLRGSIDVGAATQIDAYVTSVNTGEAFGLGVTHDLGGGVSLNAGASRSVGGNTMTDLGVRFNF